MLLMPVLEIESKKFSDFLKEVEISAPDYSDVIRRFPKYLLLKHVFHTSVSGYWPERALAWLKDDADIQPLFENELEKFVNQKTMPQNARQTAKKIVNSLRNHQG